MIKISVPNDDHVALRAMAKALEEIAVARGAPAQSVQVTMGKIDFNEPIPNFVGHRSNNAAEVDTTSQQIESLMRQAVEETEQLSTAVKNWVPEVANREVHFDNPAPQVSDATTDSTGTPWDERIHSASKALNADGTWRLRRKPADMEGDEWSLYVAYVQNELKNGDLDQAHYVSETAEGANDIAEPTVTPEGDDFHVDADVVTEQQVASFPPPPPVPQLGGGSQSTPYKLVGAGDDLSSGAGVTPQTAAITAASGGGAPVTMSFPQVMAFLTERHGRITSAQVDQIIADMGLEKITDLNTQPEYTGPFIARVKALLGE